MQAKIALALVIYNGEQVACAQLIVPLLRRWARSEIEEGREPDDDDETIAGSPEESDSGSGDHVVDDQEKSMGKQ